MGFPVTVDLREVSSEEKAIQRRRDYYDPEATLSERHQLCQRTSQANSRTFQQSARIHHSRS